MSPQLDFFKYLGVAGATIVLLFGAQKLLASSMDVHWHEQLKDRPANVALAATRAEETAALEHANVVDAMLTVAKSRTANKRVQPKASSDLSAMSGWVQAPDFAPYEPKVVPAPTVNAASGR